MALLLSIDRLLFYYKYVFWLDTIFLTSFFTTPVARYDEAVYEFIIVHITIPQPYYKSTTIILIPK